MDQVSDHAASEFLQTIIDSLDDELLVIDRDFRITHANQAFLKAKDWHRARVVGRHCYEVSHGISIPCETPQDDCPARQVWNTGQPARCTHTHFDSSGNPSYVEIVASPLKDAKGDLVGVVEVLRNVTMRRHLEEVLLQNNRELADINSQLHAEKRRMEAVVKGIGDGVTIQDRNMRIIYANDVLRQLFGEDIVGKLCFEAYERREKVCPDCPVKTAFETGQPARSLQEGVTLADEHRHFDISAGPILDDNGEVVQVVEVVRDVTREIELAKMKNEFISVTSHEFRAPLAIMRGYAEMILNRERLGLDPSEGAHLLRHIIEEVDGLAMLVEDTLNVSRLDGNEMRASLQPVLLNRTVEDIVESMAHDAKERNIQISVDIPRRLVAYADPAYVERILVNLLSNALNYSDDGTGVCISARVAKQMIEVAVRDQGVGMSSEQIRQLFGKFTRFPNPRSSLVKGTGLGLYITKGLVEAQAGSIWVESKLGVGTTFSFTLPLAAL